MRKKVQLQEREQGLPQEPSPKKYSCKWQMCQAAAGPSYEYLRLRLDNFPEDVIAEYNLKDIVTSDGYVYIEVRKGMHGLPQAGLLAQELLEKRLEKHGYKQSKHTPGFCTHKSSPICFSLVVDDFGVEYVGEDNAKHLIQVLEEHYDLSKDWHSTKYCGLLLDWDYKK